MTAKYDWTMDWEKFDGDTKIKKVYEFNNFSEALSFTNKVGKLAEEANHHPDILIHNYKKVSVFLTTHEVNALTEKDFKLARRIDELL